MPHLSFLGCSREILGSIYAGSAPPSAKINTKTRLTQKSKNKEEASFIQQINWHNAWCEYVRGNIVSHAAADFIQSFLLKTMATSGSREDADDESEADQSDKEPGCPPLQLPVANFRQVLMPTQDDSAENSEPDNNPTGLTGKFTRATRKRLIRNE